MTSTIVLNLVLSILGVGAFVLVARLGALVAHGKFDEPGPVRRLEAPSSDLERAA
jgi:hypothetical protein